MMVPAKKLFIRTFGCQMNVYDSGRMADALAPAGYQTAETPDEADLVILNTCHIREKAAEKVYSEVGRLRAVKDRRARAGRETLIAVAGCVAQAEGEEIVRRAPLVDLVFGPQAYHRLPELVGRAGNGEPVIDTEFPLEDKFEHLPRTPPARLRGAGPTAFLTIQEGCDRFCTFCVVPYTRGAEASRPARTIINEAREMMDAGVREITLLGQNVNGWHGEGLDGGEWGLGRLLRALAEIEGLERLRYTTSHPRDMDDDLIAAHGDTPEVMPFLHLPVQSGSDRVLALMNRRHGRDDYLRLIGRIREVRPDIAVSGDFIVGFPGERDADFEDTLDLVRAVGHAQAFSFKFSPRPGTPAAGMEDEVPEPVKAERLARLQALLAEQQRAFNAATVGRTLPVLLERPGRKPGQLVGRSPYLQAVHVDAPSERRGEIVEVEITELGAHSLSGRIAGAPALEAVR